MKKIGILGSTGSIGRQALDIVSSHRSEIEVVSLAAGAGNLTMLSEQVRLFRPQLVSVPDEKSASVLRGMIGPCSTEIVHSAQGLEAVAAHDDVETLLTAVVGFLGLLPTAAAIRKGKTIALANKETLVAAGSIIMPMAKEHRATIVPVDSEHSAICQSLAGYESNDISKIILTGSGGPFRTWTHEQIANATVREALKHPNWSMGDKITIDSATLMNKGLEIIEARWLFNVSPEQVEVVIHPQSILHSAVEFKDGSIVGQMGLPDMHLPIHYALFWPNRVPSTVVPRLDLVALQSMTFEKPDERRFPCLRLARQVAGCNDTRPCVLNAANEVFVDAFLKGRIKFMEIAQSIETILSKCKPVSQPTLEDILEADRWTRKEAGALISAPA
jgi:1-deoxy-D-xylulose-5-phosphate reductoisomerase